MKSTSKQEKHRRLPARASTGAATVGFHKPRVAAAEWMDRLVSALANGVKGGTWQRVQGCHPFYAISGLLALSAARQTARHSLNHRLESRMRENRPYGSEGGEANGLPDPYPDET